MDHSKRNQTPKARIVRKNSDDAAAKVEARTGLYNPLLQKPVSLEPVGPGSYPAGGGGYAYIGPPPDFGGSYGAYVDTAGRKQYGVKTSKQYSIYDGSPISLHSEVSPEEQQALLSQMDEMHEDYKCESCRAELTVSAPIQADKIHCPLCSSEMSGAVDKVKSCYSKLEEKKAMATKQAVKAEMDLAKEAMKMESPAAANDAVKLPKEVDVVPVEHEKDAKNVDMMKEVENPKETVVKSAAQIKASAQRRERLEAARKAFQSKKKQGALASLRKKESVKAGTDAKKAAELRRELRIMATFQPAKFAEVQKNARLAPICAEVAAKLYSKEERAQVRAELAEMAKLDPAQAAEAKKHLDFVAPEILMEGEGEEASKKAETAKEEPSKKEESSKMAEAAKEEGSKKEEMSKKEEPSKKAESAKEEGSKLEGLPVAEEGSKAPKAEAAKEEGSKAAPKAEGEEGEAAPMPVADEADAAAMPMESMKTEFLASLSKLPGERIEMSLYGEETNNPFWNVTIDAEPVGRIYLADQEQPEQIRAGFVADNYAAHFGQAVEQLGVEKMLGLVKARLFAHRNDDSEALARVKASAKAEAKVEFDSQVQTLRQDFVQAVAMAITASDKNMYKDEAGHALKGGLFSALAQLNLEPGAAVWAIEAGFEASPAYFDFVTKKAIEIMDMPVEARSSFQKFVAEAGKQEIAETSREEESLRDRLVKASVTASAMGDVLGGEDKEAVRQNMNLNARRR